MSRKNKLPNTKKAIRRYLKSISALPYVEKIYLVGSRSPISKSKPRKDSDWDFKIYSSLSTLKLPHPRRDLKLVHADIIMMYDNSNIKTDKKAVEIYPTDEYKILK